MIPDIIVVACLGAPCIHAVSSISKNSKYREAEESRQESERSKSVFSLSSTWHGSIDAEMIHAGPWNLCRKAAIN